MTEERGSSMVEMIGVIGILGVVAMSVWTLINSARDRYRLSQGVLQVQSLEKGITRFYAAAGNYNKLDVKDLIANRIPPPGMTAGEDKLRHVFGGEVELATVAYSNEEEFGSSRDSFVITFKALGSSECREMASIVWPQNDAANLVSITVGTTKFVWPSYSSSEETANSVLPVTIAAAMEVCTEDSQDISWEFR